LHALAGEPPQFARYTRVWRRVVNVAHILLRFDPFRQHLRNHKQLGETMLEVDLEGDDILVERSITESCAVYGRVASVKVHRQPSPFAVIEMSRREQTYAVAERFGGSAFGTAALVHLAPTKK
jgi:hypothetical protein